MLELYYVLVVWSFYVELKEEAEAMLLPMQALEEGAKAANCHNTQSNGSENDQDVQQDSNHDSKQK